MRYLRATWHHGYGITATLGGLTVGAVELARGYGPTAILGASLGAGLTYGLLRLYGALRAAGVLRVR